MDLITHHMGGGVYMKETRIPAGAALVQHRHAFDHLSYLVSGSVLLLVDGETRRVDAPACLTIEAHKHHGVRALVDSTWLCIWPESCADDDGPHIEEPTTDMQKMAEGML